MFLLCFKIFLLTMLSIVVIYLAGGKPIGWVGIGALSMIHGILLTHKTK